MIRNALWLGDRREEELLKEIRTIYGRALETALKKQQRFFKKIEDIESGKYKPPQYYVQRGTVKKWRQGFVREALRQEQVIQGIMNVLNKAGKEASALMTPYLADIYRYNRDETVRILQGEVQDGYGITPNFAMYDPRQIRILLEEKQPPFSKIAYKNMGKNLAVRNRLQREFAQAIILGEGAVKMRRRVQKCTGQLIWQARRVARTERTRIQAQARYEAAQEAADMGIGIYNEWIARMVNTRDTHAAMNGQKRMQGEPFQSPSGALLMYPGDPTSALPEEVINCQCQITTRVLLPGEKLVDEKVVKGLPDGENGGKIEEEIQIFRSLSAKAMNYDIELPDGEITHLTEGTRISNVKVIAGKGRERKIDEIATLLLKYGGIEEEWQKKKGIGYVDYQSESYKVELHWYEEPNAGRHKWKVKPDADGNWFLED